MKNRIFLLLLILSIIIIIILLFRINSNKNVVEGYRQKESLYLKEVKLWRDKTGLSRAQNVAFAANAKVMKETMNKAIEELKKDIKGLRLKNLHSNTSIETLYKDSLSITLKDSLMYINDSTIKAYTFYYSDSLFTTIRGNIINDRLNISYHSKAPLSVTIYRKRIKKRYFLDLFPPFETLVEGKSLNPKVEVTNIEAIVIKPRKKFLGIF